MTTIQPPSTESIDDVRVHGLSRGHQALCWLPAVVSVAAVGGCLAVPHLAPYRFGWIYAAFAGTLLFGWLSVAAIGYALRVRARFAVEADGLMRISPDGSITMLRWDRIGRIRERPLLQRLEVSDASGDEVMRLEYQLEGFDDLAEQVARRVRAIAGAQRGRALHPGTEGEVVFRHGWVRSATAPVMAAGAIAAFWYWLGGIVIGAVLFAAIAVGTRLWEWRRVRVGPAGLTIEAALRSHRIGADELRSVDLVTRSDRGNRLLGVVLEVVDGSRVRISRCPGGDLTLYRAVAEMHRRAPASGSRREPNRVTARAADEARCDPDADVGSRVADHPTEHVS